MISYWEKHYWYRDSDITIIGAGIVGLFTALFLRNKYPRRSITILERGSMPTGASTKNAGFACFATIGEILCDLESESEQTVIETIKLRWQGLQLLKHHIQPDLISYKNIGGTELFQTKTEFEKCEQNLAVVNGLIESAIGLENAIDIKDNEFNKLYKKGLYNKYEGELNPVLLIQSLLEILKKSNINIQFGQQVESFERRGDMIEISLRNKLSLKTDVLFVCTNAFTNQFSLDLDLVPYRNQVIVSKPLDNIPYQSCYHMDRGYIYFRNIDNRLLLGGARYIDLEAEQTVEFNTNPTIISFLRTFAKSKLDLPDFEIEHQWSGILATGNSKKPIVKPINDKIFLGVRLGGMGVAIGSKVAESLTSLYNS